MMKTSVVDSFFYEISKNRNFQKLATFLRRNLYQVGFLVNTSKYSVLLQKGLMRVPCLVKLRGFTDTFFSKYYL